MNLEYNTENNSWDSSGRPGQQTKYKQCVSVKRTMAITVVSLGLGICICLLGFMVYSESPEPAQISKKTLRFASIVFRHGARTPAHLYNSDPYKMHPWPGGLGALTNEGKLQLYNLGLMLRKDYAGFLPDEYIEDDIYVLSSDVSRTISSAYTLLAGLYPPIPKQKWHSNIAWQPIPVHTIPRNLDKKLAIKKPCVVARQQYFAAKTLPEIVNKYQELFDNLTLHCNQTMQDVLSVELLYSTLFIEKENGLKLPKWTKEYFPEKMREVTCTSFAVFTYNTILKRLQGGPLLSDILMNMKMKHDGELVPDRKMFLYSAHDLTIVALWRTLGFEECLLPEYGAALVIEMHSAPESLDSEIKLLYYNNSKQEAHPLLIPNCAAPCMLTEFQNITLDVIPLNWERECDNDSQ